MTTKPVLSEDFYNTLKAVAIAHYRNHGIAWVGTLAVRFKERGIDLEQVPMIISSNLLSMKVIVDETTTLTHEITLGEDGWPVLTVTPAHTTLPGYIEEVEWFKKTIQSSPYECLPSINAGSPSQSSH